MSAITWTRLLTAVGRISARSLQIGAAALGTTAVLIASACGSGTVRPRSEQSSQGPAAVAERLQAEWRSAITAGAIADRSKQFPSPPRRILLHRLGADAHQLGFTIVRVKLLRPRELAPIVVIRAPETQRFTQQMVPRIVQLIDHKRRTRDDRNGWDYEGLFFEVENLKGAPFVVVFNHWRGLHQGGGQWAASERLLPFIHGGRA